MSAGLPALGLGGMFYMLLIVWMVLRELARKPAGDARTHLAGRSLARWW